MIRSIDIHIDTFAELWKQRLPGETSEDSVIRRLLGMEEEMRNPSTTVAERQNLIATRQLQDDLPDSKKWTDLLIWTLEKLGGTAPLAEIYRVSREGRKALGYDLTINHDASARECLESHCLESEKYRGKQNLFLMPEGKGAGVWALRSMQVG